MPKKNEKTSVPFSFTLIIEKIAFSLQDKVFFYYNEQKPFWRYIMARRGMLYALTTEEVTALKKEPLEKRYDYMLNHYETLYFNTPRAHEFDKAWEGLHYVLGNGEWIEDNTLPYSIIFGGDEVILDENDEVLLLKENKSLLAIAEYLKGLEIKAVIKNNVPKIPEEEIDMPLDEDFMTYLFNWYEGLDDFYLRSFEAGYHVLFSVDL